MRLVSTMENEGTVMLDSVGNYLEMGKEISIRESDVNNADIQYVINNKMAKIVNEKDEEIQVDPQFEAGETVAMYCPLDPDMTLTLDSVKASCKGGQTIHIDKREMENNDIREAIKGNMLVEKEEHEEDVKEIQKKAKAKKVEKQKTAEKLTDLILDEDDDEEDEESTEAFIDETESGFEKLANSLFDEVSMDDVKLSDKAKAKPKTKKAAKKKTAKKTTKKAAKKKTAKKTTKKATKKVAKKD